MIASPSVKDSLENPAKITPPLESQVAYMKRRRAEKRRQVRLRRLKGLFRLLVFAVLVYGIVTFIRQPFWTFQASHVSVLGNHLVPKQGLLPFIQPYAGKPLYEIPPAEIIKNIREHYPIIDHMVVRRLLLPTRLELMLTEKTPWAAVYFKTPPFHQISQASPPEKEDLKPFPNMPESFPQALITTDSHFIDFKGYPNPEILFRKAKMLPPIYINPALEASKSLDKSFYSQLNILTQQLQAVPGLTFQYLWIPSPKNISAHFSEADVLIGALDITTTERVERLLMMDQALKDMQTQIQWVDLRWQKQLTLHKKLTSQNDLSSKANNQDNPAANSVTPPLVPRLLPVQKKSLQEPGVSAAHH